MTATQLRDLEADATAPVAQPALRTRRQPRWIAFGLLSICLGGLGAGWLYSEAVASNEVVVAARAVPRGEVLKPGDLTVTRVGSIAGVSSVPGVQLEQLAGKTALVDLQPGTLVPQSGIGTVELQKGSSQVGLKLAPGRLPSGELSAGTPVLLVPLEDPRAALGSSVEQAAIAGVLATVPKPGPDQVSIVVDVRVPSDKARKVAELAATDRIAVVREADR